MAEKLPQKSDMLIYQTEDGQSKIDVRLEDGTVWLSQRTMADLFQTSVANINIHLNNIFKERELPEDSAIKESLITAKDKKRYRTKLYNLDAIIAVGYRVRSHRGTQFRRWATERLKDYLVKGFAMDDERLKEGRNLGADYFDELLERIRDIRSSEKRFYRKICDIYALSVDYDPHHSMTLEFFQTVQNKMHFAVHGHTAAELIAERVSAEKPNMGLTTWKGAKIRAQDVTVAKNYLSEDELKVLNRIVTMYLDYAEDQAQRKVPVYMKDWKTKLDAFLQFNGRKILDNAGKVAAKVAETLALKEYAKYHKRQLEQEALQTNDEFDRTVKRIEDKNK